MTRDTSSPTIPPTLDFLRLFETQRESFAFISSEHELIYSNRSFQDNIGRFRVEIEARLGLISLAAVKQLDIEPYYRKAIQGEEQIGAFTFSQNGVPFLIEIRLLPYRVGDKTEGILLECQRREAGPGTSRTSRERTSFAEALIGLSDSQIIEANHPRGLGFWSMDIASDRVTFSPQLLEDWSVTQGTHVETMAEAIGKIYPEDQAQVRAALASTLLYGDKYWTEYRIAADSGELLWMEARAEIILDERGRPQRLTGTVHDITGRKKIESELRYSERWFRALSDFMPQMIWTASPEGIGTYFNKKWLDYVGLSQPDALRHQAYPYIHSEDRGEAMARWANSCRSGEPFEMEFRLRRESDQSYRWHLSRALPLRDEEGNIVRWLGTSTDTNEQKQLREELQAATAAAETAARAKSTFLANMSHEIRTPLTAILGFTELLRKEPDSDKQERYLQVIHRNSQVLSQLINDILDISKFESGNFLVEDLVFRLDKLLDEVMGAFTESAVLKSIGLRHSIASESELELRSDPGRLRQILTNIIGNAIKFTDRGSVDVRARTEKLAAGNLTLHIEVQDSGIGLKDEEAEKLFHPFSQADQSTTRKFGGTGLGLDLSRKLARALGGDVQLSAYSFGKGCTFHIQIPVQGNKGVSRPIALPPERLAPIDAPNPSSEIESRVLLVEDAIENQFLVSEMLGGRGYTIDIANNGQEALDLMAKESYDIILMDMQMPVLDGYAATRRLRELGYKLPILALTALALESESREILANGCDAHFTKPINFPLLIATMARLTGKKA